MPFKARELPEAIVVDDYMIAGPFCENCGNPGTTHHAETHACPKRRLHPLLPVGLREHGCICARLAVYAKISVIDPQESCPVFKYHFDAKRDSMLAYHLTQPRG